MSKENEMRVLRIIVGKREVARIRSKQFGDYCDVQPINEGWKGEEENGKKHLTKKDADRMVKISRNNIPARWLSPGRPKRR